MSVRYKSYNAVRVSGDLCNSSRVVAQAQFGFKLPTPLNIKDAHAEFLFCLPTTITLSISFADHDCPTAARIMPVLEFRETEKGKKCTALRLQRFTTYGYTQNDKILANFWVLLGAFEAFEPVAQVGKHRQVSQVSQVPKI
ncbi:hypothetical protein BJV74DRAFT_793471 [Russula compacta]|nr:hypothetical protein BJV74DRAFT_793471 [Russula compacta]